MELTTIRWAVAGTGAIANSFACGLKSVPGTKLAAVASRSRAAADSFASRFGAERAYCDYDEMLGDPGIDVVYVATPNETHQQYCLSGLEAGKAMFCEKPFALDANQGRGIVAAARKYGLFCAEAMWMRFSPAMQEALRAGRDGAIGEIRLLAAQLGFPNVVDPKSRLFTTPGGGALLDLGVYPLSLAQAVFGAPVRVSSSAVMATTGVDEQVTAVLDYAEGGQALIAASLRSQLSNRATLYGTCGMIDIRPPLVFPSRYSVTMTPVRSSDYSGPARGVPQLRATPLVRSLLAQPAVRMLVDQRARLRTKTVVRREPGTGYRTEATEVTRCLRAGLLESPSMPLDDTVAILETLDTIRQSWAPAR